jgi:hypothetical protein
MPFFAFLCRFLHFYTILYQFPPFLYHIYTILYQINANFRHFYINFRHLYINFRHFIPFLYQFPPFSHQLPPFSMVFPPFFLFQGADMGVAAPPPPGDIEFLHLVCLVCAALVRPGGRDVGATQGALAVWVAVAGRWLGWHWIQLIIAVRMVPNLLWLGYGNGSGSGFCNFCNFF